VPIGVFLLTSLTDLVVAAIMGVSMHGASVWDTWTWLTLRAAMIPGLAILLLWYVPIAGYLILVSAWARRNVFLWAVLPPLLLIMIENRAFGTSYLFTFVQYRLLGVWKYFGDHGAFSPDVWTGRTPSLGQLFETVGATRALSDIDLWLGIAVGIALAYGAVRIRRYRDDT
jgi:ABC-2 type transport system permease protein